jgi:hypothetical protein
MYKKLLVILLFFQCALAANYKGEAKIDLVSFNIEHQLFVREKDEEVFREEDKKIFAPLNFSELRPGKIDERKVLAARDRSEQLVVIPVPDQEGSNLSKIWRLLYNNTKGYKIFTLKAISGMLGRLMLYDDLKSKVSLSRSICRTKLYFYNEGNSDSKGVELYAFQYVSSKNVQLRQKDGWYVKLIHECCAYKPIKKEFVHATKLDDKKYLVLISEKEITLCEYAGERESDFDRIFNSIENFQGTMLFKRCP